MVNPMKGFCLFKIDDINLITTNKDLQDGVEVLKLLPHAASVFAEPMDYKDYKDHV